MKTKEGEDGRVLPGRTGSLEKAVNIYISPLPPLLLQAPALKDEEERGSEKKDRFGNHTHRRTTFTLPLLRRWHLFIFPRTERGTGP